MNWHTTSHKEVVLSYNTLISNQPMSLNYLCLVDGVVEYGSTSLSDFAHYQLVYAEDHQDADVQYLTLTDEEYDEMFPCEEEE
jgi:hypothetical protein